MKNTYENNLAIILDDVQGELYTVLIEMYDNNDHGLIDTMDNLEYDHKYDDIVTLLTTKTSDDFDYRHDHYFRYNDDYVLESTSDLTNWISIEEAASYAQKVNLYQLDNNK